MISKNTIFKQVARKKVRTNTFDLSHEKKMSLDFGKLTPCFIMDTIPGDVVKVNTSQLIRLAPMVTPVMHRVNVYVHFFFVPNRILWPNWEKFITGGEDGFDASVFPTIPYSGDSNGGLPDYLGCPPRNTAGTQTHQISAMPFAAYQKIYNEYYRDQNLIDAVPDELVDGNNVPNDGPLKELRKRSWQHDYFTAALPWTQKGPEATIPLGTNAYLQFDEDGWPDNPNQAGTFVKDSATGAPVGAGSLDTNATGRPLAGSDVADIDVTGVTRVDLSNSAAASINELRRAFRLQEWLEKNARAGSRYTESLLAHFDVKSQDSRLQRPEYLGGGSSPVVFSEVLQTSGTPEGDNQYTPTPQGNMAGHGINTGSGAGFSYYCQEHGYILGIMSIMPVANYFQGFPRHFFKWDKFDYAWPSFANLGEQAILNSEIYWSGNSQPTNEETFGYIPRYAEYKYMPSTIHGDFRDTLDKWHMARKFDSLPALNQTFIEMDFNEVDRIFAVTEDTFNKLYAYVFHNVKAKRKLPVFGTPSI